LSRPRLLCARWSGLGLTAPFANRAAGSCRPSRPGGDRRPKYKPDQSRWRRHFSEYCFWGRRRPCSIRTSAVRKPRTQEGARIFYEPLRPPGNPDGNLVPGARRRKSRKIEKRRGSLPTACSVNWRLKKGVEWHDGPARSTADDVVSNWEYYAADPATAATTIGSLSEYREVEKGSEPVEPCAVRFKKADPRFWADAFVRYQTGNDHP